MDGGNDRSDVGLGLQVCSILEVSKESTTPLRSLRQKTSSIFRLSSRKTLQPLASPMGIDDNETQQSLPQPNIDPRSLDDSNVHSADDRNAGGTWVKENLRTTQTAPAKSLRKKASGHLLPSPRSALPSDHQDRSLPTKLSSTYHQSMGPPPFPFSLGKSHIIAKNPRSSDAERHGNDENVLDCTPASPTTTCSANSMLLHPSRMGRTDPTVPKAGVRKRLSKFLASGLHSPKKGSTYYDIPRERPGLEPDLIGRFKHTGNEEAKQRYRQLVTTERRGSFDEEGVGTIPGLGWLRRV